MAIRRFKPSPRQELIGRSALVVLGVLCAYVGFWTGWLSIKILFALGEARVDRPGPFVLPLMILSALLLLSAVVLAAMAFVPGREGRRGPLTGWPMVNRAYDRFWDAVRWVAQRMGD